MQAFMQPWKALGCIWMCCICTHGSLCSTSEESRNTDRWHGVHLLLLFLLPLLFWYYYKPAAGTELFMFLKKNKHINTAISFVSESNGTGVKTEQQLHTAMWTDRGTASAPAAQLLLRPYLTVCKCKENRSFCDEMACKKKKRNSQYQAQPQEERKYVF